MKKELLKKDISFSNEWVKVFRAELEYREKLNSPEKIKITY